MIRMKNKVKLIGKLLMSIALLICLMDMSYGYYQLVRFVGMVTFGLLAFSYYQNKQNGWMYFYGSSAILLNPIFIISLGRTIWKIVDVILVIIIIVNILTEIRKTSYNMQYTKKR
jgi:hypothetical protein